MLRGLLWKEAFGLHIEEENQDLKSYSTETARNPKCRKFVFDGINGGKNGFIATATGLTSCSVTALAKVLARSCR